MFKTRRDAKRYLHVFLEANRPAVLLPGIFFIVCRDTKLEIVNAWHLFSGDLTLLRFSSEDLVKGFSSVQWDTLVVKVLSLAHVLKFKDAD